MGLWVVVGGQYGSEGKGKIAAVIAIQNNIDLAIRCGGPNSGHTFMNDDGTTSSVRQLPTAFINPNTRLLIPAGATVDLDILKYEIDSLGIPPERVGVDRNAMIIEAMDKEAEKAQNLGARLSSTLCGVGAAAARRLMRNENVRLASTAARDVPWLTRIITDVAAEANHALDARRNVLVEGTQGFGLSLFHSEHYPKTTSKDTTASAFLSEVGISPVRVTEIVLVLRTFPIRVSGAQAGPLSDEIDWEILQRESGYPYAISELTTVTRSLRRISRFDWQLARRAAMFNKPTSIAVNCLDHLDFRDRNVQSVGALSKKSLAFLKQVESDLGSHVGYLGTGPKLSDVFVTDKQRNAYSTRDQVAS